MAVSKILSLAANIEVDLIVGHALHDSFVELEFFDPEIPGCEDVQRAGRKNKAAQQG
jgi:hypothetical protein